MTKILTIILAAALLTGCSESTTTPSSSASTIHVSAPTSSVVVGDSLEVRAFATAADGAPFRLTTVAWTSSNLAIATVTATGPLSAMVRTLSAGSVAIKALVNSGSGELALSVTAFVPPAPSPEPETLPNLAFIWSSETGMTALTFPPDVERSYATDINDLGQVVGSVIIAQHSHAFVWTIDGGMTDIGALIGSVDSYATAINNSGQVLGGTRDASGHSRQFRWSPSEGLIELTMPAGTENAYARSINASGVVVGERNASDSPSVPFRWSQEKGTEDLPLSGSDGYAAAMAIADNGDVVGYSGRVDTQNDVTRAVLWSASNTIKIIDACTDGWFAYDFTYVCHSSANAINSAGQIILDSEWGLSVAILSALGARQDIRGLSGLSSTSAAAINEAGQVVGSSISFPSQVGRAFLWSPIGGTIDLGALPGRQWSRATGINNRGQIVGSSY